MSTAHQHGHDPLVELLAAEVSRKDLNGVRALVKAGADVNARKEGGAPIIWLATDDRILELLVDAGGDINARWDDVTMLHHAAMVDYDRVRLLLGHGADPNARNAHGETPLFYAGSSGKAEIVELLIMNGANIDVQRLDGWTTLHRVIIARHYDAAEVLVRLGADLELRENIGMTPLIFAVNMYDLTKRDILGLLITHGADVNAPGSHSGWRPIHSAASHGSNELIRRLVDAGADLKARTEDGETAWDVAARWGHAATAQLLHSLRSGI